MLLTCSGFLSGSRLLSNVATRGWEHATDRDVRDRRLTPKLSKYRNVKRLVDGIRFDSQHEADVYLMLKAQQQAGVVRNLFVQVPLILCAPILIDDADGFAQVAVYVADFVFDERCGAEWRHVVADAKGVRTPMYKLKAKWLALQEGIIIREL